MAPHCSERRRSLANTVAYRHRLTRIPCGPRHASDLQCLPPLPCPGGETGRRKGLETLSIRIGNDRVNGVKFGETAPREGDCNPELSRARRCGRCVESVET